MNIIILGPQGSGKGTQAKMLAEKFELEYFEMGRIFREVAKEDTPLGKHIHEIINIKGQLVDDKSFREVFASRLQKIPRDKGILFEGVPRRKDQLEYFKKEKGFERKIGAVIAINLPEEDSIERLSKRWVCQENEHVLIMGKDIKSENEKCPVCCGSGIFQRIDDTPERIKIRLGIYHKDTEPVIDYFRQKGLLIEIDGRPSIEEVNKDILKKIEEQNIL